MRSFTKVKHSQKFPNLQYIALQVRFVGDLSTACVRRQVGYYVDEQIWNMHTDVFHVIEHFSAIHGNCRLLSHLRMHFDCLYCKHCGPTPDCSLRSSLVMVHSVCYHDQK